MAGWVCYNQTWLYFSPNNSLIASLGHRKLIDTDEALVHARALLLSSLSCRGGPLAIVAVVVAVSGDGLADGCSSHDGPGACFWRVWGAEIFDGDGVIVRWVARCSEGITMWTRA